ncbi:MAG: DoxX family protein [Bacteroidetes bacterium]|nr:DoxX family protein [Bacteroidota bacterium]MCL5025744.1 DoxX family protein [Chloroflexota bacterium]
MPITIDVGLLILRIVIGVVFMGHGSQKLFGWFGGGSLSGQTRFAESLGLRPARLWALISALGEFLGGLGVLVGLLTPIAATGILASMLIAIIKVHWPNGFWNANRGIEWPLVLAAVAFVIGLTGPGAYSLDRALGVALPEPLTYSVLIILMLIGIVVALATARVPPRPR